MGNLKLVIDYAWNSIQIIAANPFLLAFVAIGIIGDIAVWAVKRR